MCCSLSEVGDVYFTNLSVHRCVKARLHTKRKPRATSGASTEVGRLIQPEGQLIPRLRCEDGQVGTGEDLDLHPLSCSPVAQPGKLDFWFYSRPLQVGL